MHHPIGVTDELDASQHHLSSHKQLSCDLISPGVCGSPLLSGAGASPRPEMSKYLGLTIQPDTRNGGSIKR